MDTQTGHERLAVVGEDSVRADRRYSYKAVDDLGGFCFENGKMVSCVCACFAADAGGLDVAGGAERLRLRSYRKANLALNLAQTRKCSCNKR